MAVGARANYCVKCGKMQNTHIGTTLACFGGMGTTFKSELEAAELARLGGPSLLVEKVKALGIVENWHVSKSGEKDLLVNKAKP